jgi:ketosteroid isomerase-like protein
MADEDEILALSVGYATAADRRDVAAFLAVFTPDARLRVSAPGAPDDIVRAYDGADELAQIPVRLGVYDSTAHEVGAAALRVDGDAATGEVRSTAHHIADGSDKVLTIRYVDRYRCTDAGWRITERTVHIDRSETVPV